MINRQGAKSAKKGLIMENNAENKKCFTPECFGFSWRPWCLGGEKGVCL
jgi:hypothetical protein